MVENQTKQLSGTCLSRCLGVSLWFGKLESLSVMAFATCTLSEFWHGKMVIVIYVLFCQTTTGCALTQIVRTGVYRRQMALDATAQITSITAFMK